MSKTISPKQQMIEADRRFMADLIKRSRARFAALPESFKRGIVRDLEDGAAQAAEAIRSAL